MFTTRLEFTEGGTFTVPDGVNELRVILIGGGDGGAFGRGAYAFGAGAYVYESDIGVTAGETYTITIGAGGAAGENVGAAGGETTFGDVSSLQGKRYTPAYTDLASGKAYAMRGTSHKPTDGTGNGGYYNYAGASGAVILYYREAADDA